MEKQQINVPVIIQDYINGMFTANRENVRDNYRDIILNIVAVCQQALDKFERDQKKARRGNN